MILRESTIFPKKLFNNEKFQFILNNKRLCAIDNTKIAVTIFNISKNDTETASKVMQRLCDECKIHSIKALGEIDVTTELYQYQYSPHLVTPDC